MQARVCELIRMQPPILVDRGLLSLSGATVPTDGTDGYQPGCIFQHTDGGDNTALYVNEGSVTSCEFNALMTTGDSDVLLVGEFSSVTQGSGIPISSSQTGAAKIYSDDAGANIATSCRGLLSRFLLTTDASGSSIRAAMGQLKLATGVDVTTGIYTAVQGYVELAGTHVSQTGATFSCIDASLEIGTALTVDSGGEACGLHVETTGTGTITNNGTCAGILIDKASGAANWPYGVYVVGACANQAFVAGAQDTGVDTTTAYPFAVEIHNEANADITSGATGSSAGIYNRYAIEAAQTSQCNHISVFAKLRVKANLADGNHVGVYGLVEQSAGTISGTGTTLTAAGHFALDISPVNITTGHLNGICIDSSVATGGTMNATMAGIRIKKSGANRAWPTGITIEAAAADIGIYSSVTTKACEMIVSALPADARGARFAFACATPAMTDGYGAFEIDLTVSGTATDKTVAASTWINAPSGATLTNYNHVHSDGIWDGGATLTGAYISWAKYQCLLQSNPAWCSLWELNFDGANSEVNSLFNVNNAELALGYQAGTPTKAAVGSIPFCSTAGGVLRYIYLYDAPDSD